MTKPKRTLLAYLARTLKPHSSRVAVVFGLFLLVSPLFSYTRAFLPASLTRVGLGAQTAYAATNDTLNFQARLENGSGAIAPDGYYNLQFKLYDAPTGGTLLWTETYYDSNGVTAGNDNRVRVANGYVTVNLGSQTAFPSTMPWDQQLYLTMNVGGTTQTATPTWDGEMNPRLKLTAVPYAFNAKTASQIVSSSGANLASLSIAAPTSGNQSFTIQDQGAAGNYNILTQNQINAGFIQNQNAGVQATSNFWISGTGRADTAFQAPLFDSGTAAALGIGTTNATSISIGKTTVTTTIQGPFVANGSQFTNNGSTLLTGTTLTDFGSSGAIGTAAATVDAYTTFVIPQTTAGRTLNLPTPTSGTAGRLAYVLNTGSTAFTMHGVSIQNGKAQTYIYDGSTWTATNIDGAGNGVTFIGTLDSQTKSGDGAVVSGNGIYLQTADGTNPGLVSTGIQTFAGNKTFSGLITGNAGATVSGATINLNVSSNFDTNINTGTSTGAVTIGNSVAGNISVQSGATITVTGTTNINSSGAAATNLGTGTGNTALGNTTGTTSITGSTNTVLGTTNINTTGTAGTTIGSATGGAVSVTANAASSFTTNTGALTLTSAAAATWGTNAGLLTLQGAGGTTVTSSAGATTSNVTIATGNASAGASGNISIDTGTATTTAGTVSIGTTNASAVTIGRAATTTTIQGNTAVTLSATTGTTMVCRNGSNVLSSCDATFLTPTASNFIQNQNAAQQTSANFWIQGTGRADTSILTPALDAPATGTLSVGTGANTSAITLGRTGNAITVNSYLTDYVDGAVRLSGTTTSGDYKLQLTGTLNSSSTGYQVGLTNALNFNPAGASVSGVYSLNNQATLSGSSLTVPQFTGINTNINTAAGFTGTITNGYGINIGAPTLAGSKITNYYGLSVANPSQNGGNTSGLISNSQIYVNSNTAAAGTGGTVNNYGIRLFQPAGSAAGGNTSNYGIYLTGNGNSSGSGVNYAIYNSSTAANYLQGNTSIGTSSNPDNYALNVNGTVAASTSILTPLLDTATAVALNIGTTNATSINLNQDTVLAAGQSITITGGNTASRPASPTEGMVYYDTTTKQLLTYANGKWQADRAEAVIVAASNSSDADKAAADYVATGTADQTVINTALTAADPAGSGRKTGKVVLLAGTYTTTDVISVPNNTTLAGVGRGTLIQFGNIAGQTKNMVSAADASVPTGVVVRDLRLDGNKSVNTTGTMHGVYITSSTFYGTGPGSRTGHTITNLYVTNFRSNGIFFDANSGNSSINNNTVQDNAGIGIVIKSTHYNNVTNNIVHGNTGDGIWVTGASYNVVANNNLISNSGRGIVVDGSANSNTINSNAMRDNGSAAEASILITNASTTLVANNAIIDNTGAGAYAIDIFASTATNVYLSNNTMTGSAVTNGVHDLGTGTVFGGQLSGVTGTGAYLIQNAGGVNVYSTATSTASTASGDLNIKTGNATGTTSNSGSITLDVGTATGTKGTIKIGDTVAAAITIGNGSSTTTIQGNTGVTLSATTGTTMVCRNGSGYLSSCDATFLTPTATNFIQNQSAADQTANLRISGTARANTSILTPLLDTATAVALNIGTTNATSITIAKSTVNTTIASNSTFLGTNNGSIVLSAVAQTGAAAGNNLTIRAGTGGTGNQNGGTLALSGGSASGTGVKGLITIDPAAFTGASQNCTVASCSITAATVDANSTALVNNTFAGSTVTLADPTITTAGRVMYVTNSGTQDMTLSVNGGGQGNTIALKPNTTATMFWNGADWTAAGASSATDLQAAYNNTQTAAGGAEIVLRSTSDSPAGTGGLTVRNNSSVPISGGLLEIQTSIGTNLFSVNSYGTELAANGGAETAGGSATTFPSNTWSAQSAATVTRTITSGEYQTGEAGVKVATGASNLHGVRNQLTGNPAVSTTYTVSFTAASSTAGQNTTPIEVIYSHDNGTTLTNVCQGFGGGYTTSRPISNSTNYNWTKVTCTVTTTAAAVTTPLLIIRQTDSTARTIYIDNLSFIRNDSTTRPANVQMGGGNTGGQVTLFTLDRSSTAPLVSNGDDRYIGSMYYDTTLGNIQCYEADGWGACGSAPDNIITFTPEYTGAVLNGTGVGTMTADFCGNGGGLSVNTGFCASGEARNYYKWTSPQASPQTYSIYVAYKLPSTFKQFVSGTTSLTGLVDSTTNAGVTYSIFRKASAGGLTSCSASKTVVGSGTGSANTWTTAAPTTDPNSCTSFAAGDTVIVQINVTAQSNAAAYVENLTFRYQNN